MRWVDAKREEWPIVLWALAYFFFLLSSYYVLRPVRDAMGIAGGVENLPWLFTATFVAMLAAVPVFGALVARFPRRRLVPLVYHFFALNLLVFFALFHEGVAPAWVARVFFVWLSVFNLFVISVFWSFLADVFTSEQGERLFPFIAAGGTAGAVAGPAMTALLAEVVGVAWLLLIAAVILELAVICVHRLGRRARDARGDERIGGGVLAGLRRIARSPYLAMIGGLIWCMTTVVTFLYFEQARIVDAALADSAEQTRFFAIVDLATNALTIAFQVFLTAEILARFGLAWALALLPAIAALGLVALAAAPGLLVLGIVQVLRRAMGYGVARPAREILFTAVRREDKYKAKNALDTVVYRGGDAIAGWARSGVVALGAGAATALAALPVAGVWAVLGIALGRRYQTRQSRPEAAEEEIAS